MSDDDFDDLETFPDDSDDGYVRIRKDDLKAVRSAARKRGAAERELSEYKRRDAVRAAGIDGLSERQVGIVAREAGSDSPEALRAVAEELGFISPAPPSEEEQQNEAEINQQNEAVNATSGAPAVASQTTVSPADAAAWGVDKRMRLLNQHPDIHERLLRGEEVVLPSSFS